MTRVIGHRGARGLAPENTLASLQAALDCGVDEIEIDLRVTKDGVPVLNHDRTLMGPKKLRVAAHSLAELRAAEPSLPTFAEAIELIKRRVPLLVEVKPRADTTAIAATFAHYLGHGWRDKDFVIVSFSQRTLTALHKALPTVPMAVSDHISGLVAVWRARRVGTKRLHFNHRNLWWGYIAAMHRKGYSIYTYTLNKPATAKRWEKYGLAGVITDFPDRFTNQNGKAKDSASSKR